MLAGCAGLVVFLLLHALWILPIWFILPIGLPIAAVGGLAVGWGYGEVRPRLRGAPWTVPVFVGLIAAILAPANARAISRSRVVSRWTAWGQPNRSCLGAATSQASSRMTSNLRSASAAPRR